MSKEWLAVTDKVIRYLHAERKTLEEDLQKVGARLLAKEQELHSVKVVLESYKSSAMKNE